MGSRWRSWHLVRMSTFLHTASPRRGHGVRRIAGTGLIVDPFRPATGVVELIDAPTASARAFNLSRRARTSPRRSVLEQMTGRAGTGKNFGAVYGDAPAERFHTRYTP